MTSTDNEGTIEIDLTDPAVHRNPFGMYGRARETAPLARIQIPGIGPVRVVTRHEDAKTVLGDPRFVLKSTSFLRPDVPEHCRAYMQTMSERNGPEHRRLRGLVAPGFTPRRAADLGPRIEPLVGRLLDELPGKAENGVVDLLAHLAKPLPMEVICELVGIPDEDRPRWREYGAAVAAGYGQAFADAIPGIMAGAESAIARRRSEPGADVLAELIRAQTEDGDRLADAEMVTLVWHLVIAGQTPTNLIANSIVTLLSHPEQLAAVRADPSILPGAVDELIRWCGPTLLAVPRYAAEDVVVCGETVHEGTAITVSVAAANRDPRAFADPDRFDIRRTDARGHLGFGHGPHFCLGASLARVQTEVALRATLRRFPNLALTATESELRAPDPGTWRLSALPVTL